MNIMLNLFFRQVFRQVRYSRIFSFAFLKMTIEKWLSDVYYDKWGTHIWNKVDEDGGSQLVADEVGEFSTSN